MARIVVIDDDAIRLSLKLALEDADHLVEEVADGEAGMNRLRTRPADLVVTDIFMPEKEGLETIDEIKRNYPQTKINAISGGKHRPGGLPGDRQAGGCGRFPVQAFRRPAAGGHGGRTAGAPEKMNRYARGC